MSRSRFALCLSAALTGLVSASCSGGPKLYPARGKVLFQNQPAEGAVVVFHPTGADATAPKPSGKVGPDGTFSLSTHPHGDGAPAGDYTVVVTWFPSNARDLDNPKNKLPSKYATVTESRLKATVKPGPNELEPFLLTK